jgi:hypothetical protein
MSHAAWHRCNLVGGIALLNEQRVDKVPEHLFDEQHTFFWLLSILLG